MPTRITLAVRSYLTAERILGKNNIFILTAFTWVFVKVYPPFKRTLAKTVLNEVGINIYLCLAIDIYLLRRSKMIITKSPFYNEIEPNTCGIYFVYFKNNHLYIGSSGDIRRRICNHNHNWGKYIEYIVYTIYKSRMEYKQTEKRLIKHLRPDMNYVLSKRRLATLMLNS